MFGTWSAVRAAAAPHTWVGSGSGPWLGEAAEELSSRYRSLITKTADRFGSRDRPVVEEQRPSSRTNSRQWPKVCARRQAGGSASATS